MDRFFGDDSATVDPGRILGRLYGVSFETHESLPYILLDFNNTWGDDFLNSDWLVFIVKFSRHIDNHLKPQSIVRFQIIISFLVVFVPVHIPVPVVGTKLIDITK